MAELESPLLGTLGLATRSGFEYGDGVVAHRLRHRGWQIQAEWRLKGEQARMARGREPGVAHCP